MCWEYGQESWLCVHQACSSAVLSPLAVLMTRLERSTAVWQHCVQTNWEPLGALVPCLPPPGKNLSLLFAWMQLVNSFPADGNWDARLLAALEDPYKLLPALPVAATRVAAYTEPPMLCSGWFSCSLPQQHAAVVLLFVCRFKMWQYLNKASVALCLQRCCISCAFVVLSSYQSAWVMSFASLQRALTNSSKEPAAPFPFWSAPTWAGEGQCLTEQLHWLTEI